MKKKFDPSSEQIIVRLWKWCNFKCIFCNVWENENRLKIKESCKDIVVKINYKLFHSSIKDWDIVNFSISWWEPTIFKRELLFSLKYISEISKKKKIIPNIDIQTNWYNIDLKYAEQLFSNWVKNCLVSFHTIDKEVYEDIIWVSYDHFKNTVEWIKNLHKSWMIVYLNIILNKKNADNFLDTLHYIIKQFPFISDINIWIFQPHWYAYDNFKELFISYKEIQSIYNKGISLLFLNWKLPISHYVGLPICYLDVVRISVEYNENLNFRKKLLKLKNHFINNVNDLNKKQTNQCIRCLYNNVCSWIWNEYIWIQELKPLYRVTDFFNNFFKNDFAIKLNKHNDDLRKIYTSGIRQIILNTSIGTKNQIFEIAKKATIMWFYDITLYIENKIDLKEPEKLFKSGISNIQVNIKDIDLLFIEKLLEFSNIYSPQFRIDLDLFVDEYSEDNIKKLEKIWLIIPSNFISIYFIYNWKNKDIYKYDGFLLHFEDFKDNIFTVNYKKRFSNLLK